MIPLSGEGKYLLVLKFCEVFFEAPNQKVFDVTLNDHLILSELDIFGLVGHATAHDEYVPFTVSRGKLFVRDRVSELRGGRIKISFVKGGLDNPKINAIVLLKGADVNEFPRLPPVAPSTRTSYEKAAKEPLKASASQFIADPVDHDDDDEGAGKFRHRSGPRQPDPYEMDNGSMITILFIVVATIIPIVILRCRL